MSSQPSGASPVTHRITTRQLQRLETLDLHYDFSHLVIICKRCGYALKTNDDRVGRHLGEKHGVPKSERRNINSLVQSLRLVDPDTLPPCPDGSTLHPYLALQSGSICKYCNVRSGSYEVQSRHLKKSHRNEIARTGARGKQWLRDHIEDNLTFQSWKANDILRSWVVHTSDRQMQKGTSASRLFLQAAPDSIKNFAQEMLLEEPELLAKQPSVPLASEGVPKKELLTNWMRRTRWDETLGQGRRDILVTLSELPLIHSQPLWLGVHNGQELYSSVKNECKLVSIVAALDRLFDRCEETVRYTDVSVRRWLRGRFPDRPYKAPFELVMRPTSERQYRNEFKRCACFWFRVLGLSPSMARSILGQELSQRQREMLEQLWYDPVWGLQPLAAQGATSPHHDEDDLSESEDESDYDCTDDEEDGEGFDSLAEEDEVLDEKSSTNPSTRDQEVAHEDPLGDAILRLCYDMATEDFEYGRAGSCLLVYFSAVRGLSTIQHSCWGLHD